MRTFISYILSCYKLVAVSFYLFLLYNVFFVPEENINFLLIIIYSLFERSLYLLQLEEYDKFSRLNVYLITFYFLAAIFYGLFNYSDLTYWYLIFVIIYFVLMFLYWAIYYGIKENEVEKIN